MSSASRMSNARSCLVRSAASVLIAYSRTLVSTNLTMFVDLVAFQAVPCPKRGNDIERLLLEPLSAIEVGFLASKRPQETSNSRRQTRAHLGCTDSGPAMSFVVNRDCDIFHKHRFTFLTAIVHVWVANWLLRRKRQLIESTPVRFPAICAIRSFPTVMFALATVALVGPSLATVIALEAGLSFLESRVK